MRLFGQEKALWVIWDQNKSFHFNCIVGRDPIPNHCDSPYFSFDHTPTPIMFYSFDFYYEPNPYFIKPNVDWASLFMTKLN